MRRERALRPELAPRERRRAAPGPLLLLLALAACAVAPTREYPDKRFFAIEAERRAPPAAESSERTLAVRRARVASRFDGRNLVYRRGELRWTPDFYAEFLVPPAAILTEEIRTWLADSNLFRHVIGEASHAVADLALETEVAELYGDFRDPSRPLAVLGLQVFLLDGRGPHPAIAGRWEHRAEVPLEDSTAPSLVAGWSRGLAEVLAALERDLAAAEIGPSR